MAYRFKVWCDSGANSASQRSEEIDTDDMGYTETEWDALSDEQKELELKEMALSSFDWGFEPL